MEKTQMLLMAIALVCSYLMLSIPIAAALDIRVYNYLGGKEQEVSIDTRSFIKKTIDVETTPHIGDLITLDFQPAGPEDTIKEVLFYTCKEKPISDCLTIQPLQAFGQTEFSFNWEAEHAKTYYNILSLIRLSHSGVDVWLGFWDVIEKRPHKGFEFKSYGLESLDVYVSKGWETGVVADYIEENKMIPFNFVDRVVFGRVENTKTETLNHLVADTIPDFSIVPVEGDSVDEVTENYDFVFPEALSGERSLVADSILLFSNPEPACGNGLQETGEKQENCCQDFGGTGSCPEGRYCPSDTSVATSCIKPTCSSYGCEPGEEQGGSYECCGDCGGDTACPAGTTCNSNTNRCSPDTCGNGVCEPTESTANCCYDCGKTASCAEGSYCPDEPGSGCLTPVCGDRGCEPGETTDNCCYDCGGTPSCSEGTYCPDEPSAGCVEPACGYYGCEPGETTDNCCFDCGCDSGYYCDYQASESGECKKIECGDGVCDSGEEQGGQLECCQDCGGSAGCPIGSYCPEDQLVSRECIKAECGNDVCEADAGESVSTCCRDCGGTDACTEQAGAGSFCIDDTIEIPQEHPLYGTERGLGCITAECLNEICEPGEDYGGLFECCQDCTGKGCPSGYYCPSGENMISNTCLLSSCGNAECEPGETTDNCCSDCACDPSQICTIKGCADQSAFSLDLVEDYSTTRARCEIIDDSCVFATPLEILVRLRNMPVRNLQLISQSFTFDSQQGNEMSCSPHYPQATAGEGVAQTPFYKCYPILPELKDKVEGNVTKQLSISMLVQYVREDGVTPETTELESGTMDIAVEKIKSAIQTPEEGERYRTTLADKINNMILKITRIIIWVGALVAALNIISAFFPGTSKFVNAINTKLLPVLEIVIERLLQLAGLVNVLSGVRGGYIGNIPPLLDEYLPGPDNEKIRELHKQGSIVYVKDGDERDVMCFKADDLVTVGYDVNSLIDEQITEWKIKINNVPEWSSQQRSLQTGSTPLGPASSVFHAEERAGQLDPENTLELLIELSYFDPKAGALVGPLSQTYYMLGDSAKCPAETDITQVSEPPAVSSELTLSLKDRKCSEDNKLIDATLSLDFGSSGHTLFSSCWIEVESNGISSRDNLKSKGKINEKYIGFPGNIVVDFTGLNSPQTAQVSAVCSSIIGLTDQKQESNPVRVSCAQDAQA